MDELERDRAEIVELWLNDMFGRSAKVDKEKFIAKCRSAECNWIFDSNKIREKCFESIEVTDW